MVWPVVSTLEYRLTLIRDEDGLEEIVGDPAVRSPRIEVEPALAMGDWPTNIGISETHPGLRDRALIDQVLAPQVVLGQAQGGFAMGVGYALLESLPAFESGPGNGHYVIARGSDLPLRALEIEIMPPLDGDEAPKGIGEVVMIPVACSGDCDRPFRPKVITDSGDRDRVVTRPIGAAGGSQRSAPSTRVQVA